MADLAALTAAVEAGNRKDAAAFTQAALDEGTDPTAVLDAMTGAMDVVGRKFQEGELFVPEMLIAARAMKAGTEILEPVLLAAGVKPEFRAVVGTVEGDLHDIGKNLVGMMWKGGGIEVFDLGVNVSPARFVEAAREHDAHLVGVSALLTTTMPSMRAVVEAVRAAGLGARVVIGGAPVTPEFAAQIGADGYAPDAGAAVDLARGLLSSPGRIRPMTAETSTGLPAADVAVVRELAARVAQIAALPVQAERIAEWQALNDLRPARPMAMIDEIPWHELASPGLPAADELATRTTHPFARELETRFLRELYRWNHLRVDMVVEPVVDVAKVIHRPGWGLRVAEATIDQGGVVQSHHYEDQLAEPEDVDKIRVMEPSLDVAATAEREAWAHELLDGILDVRMQGLSGWNGDDLTFALWDDIETFRGTEPIMLDFMDRPEHLHAIAERMTEVRIAEMRMLEEKGLLGYGMQRIHCTGAHTAELPKAGFDPARPRAIDNWTVGRSQLFVSVGDSAFDEFVPPYYARWYAYFGLGYFGCCDPLHNRIDAVRKIPNVRKVSISAWAKVARAAEAIGPDYVYSRKPNPAMVAMDAWVPEIAERDFREVLEATRANGCPVEFTLKDISTARNDPTRLWEWCAIAERMTRG